MTTDTQKWQLVILANIRVIWFRETQEQKSAALALAIPLYVTRLWQAQ